MKEGSTQSNEEEKFIKQIIGTSKNEIEGHDMLNRFMAKLMNKRNMKFEWHELIVDFI